MYELEDNSLKLKKKIFYLIHDSKNGLAMEKIMQLIDIAKNDIEKILKDLESEAMIYLNEVDKYISYFKEDYHQRRERKLN